MKEIKRLPKILRSHRRFAPSQQAAGYSQNFSLRDRQSLILHLERGKLRGIKPKWRITNLIIIFLLFSSLVLAQNINEIGPPAPEKESSIGSDAARTEDIEKNLDELKNTASGIKEKTNALVEKEIEIPGPLKTPAKILLRLEEKTTLPLLIISIMVLIILALIFINTMTLFSPFSEHTSIAVGIALTIITSAIGLVRTIAKVLENIRDQISFLEEWGILQVSFIIFLVVLLWLIFSRVTKAWKHAREIEKVREETIKGGTATAAWEHYLKELGKTPD